MNYIASDPLEATYLTYYTISLNLEPKVEYFYISFDMSSDNVTFSCFFMKLAGLAILNFPYNNILECSKYSNSKIQVKATNPMSLDHSLYY